MGNLLTRRTEDDVDQGDVLVGSTWWTEEEDGLYPMITYWTDDEDGEQTNDEAGWQPWWRQDDPEPDPEPEPCML